MIALALALVAVAALLYARRVHRDAASARKVSGRYEALAAHLPDLSVLVYDAALRFTMLEGAALQAHGWRREEIEGRRIADVIPPERAGEFLTHCRAALAGEACTHDWTSVRDSARLYRVTHAPLRDGRGAVVGGMAVTRDVTAPEATRRELAAQRDFLAGVLDQLTDQLVACDADGRLQVFSGVGGDAIGPLDWPDLFGLRAADG